MRCDILTIFPDLFGPFLACGMMKKAQDKGLLSVGVHDLREFTSDRHRSVDDVPYGGGPGMIMKIDPIYRAVTTICTPKGGSMRILLSPQGRALSPDLAKLLSSESALFLICGRYEGVDERVRLNLVDEEVSIGDYVLNGGEIPAMVLLETVVRLIPGVLGGEDSLVDESFERDGLEYPQYTRPSAYKGWKVPDVLLSGHHEKIKEWRHRESLLRTAKRRPDLINWSRLTPGEVELLNRNDIHPEDR